MEIPFNNWPKLPAIPRLPPALYKVTTRSLQKRARSRRLRSDGGGLRSNADSRSRSAGTNRDGQAEPILWLERCSPVSMAEVQVVPLARDLFVRDLFGETVNEHARKNAKMWVAM